MDRLPQLLSFFQFIEQLKSIDRKVFTSGGRPENAAEHSWHLALLIMLLCEDFPDADFTRMLKMALIHDIVEIEAGDTFAFDEIHKESQQQREQLAAKHIFARLPEDQQQEFSELFAEYEAMHTREARIVKSLDKLQAVIQNVSSDGKGWKLHALTYEQVDAFKRPHMEHDPVILRLYELALQQAKEKMLF